MLDFNIKRGLDSLQDDFVIARTEFQEYSIGGYVESNCLAIRFENTGSVNAFLNGRPIAPGQTIEPPYRNPYFDVSKYKLDFENVAGVKSVYVTRILLAYLDG